ncbi:IS1 family transposase [Varibaculum cambriense]
MGRKSNRKKCPTCGGAGVKRNGTTSKGLQRYRCAKCSCRSLGSF